MSVEVVSFGCRLNAVEAEAMRRQAVAAGHRDLTVVNTCAVTAEATRQSRQAVRRAGRERPGARVVVTGCAAEIEPAQFAGLANVAAILPNAGKALAGTWRALPVGDATQSLAPVPDAGRRTRVFLEVQNGCDHRCTFCIIPLGRGASRSVPPEVVVERVREAVEDGAQEVVLTGVDVTAYGGAGLTLGDLVRSVLAAVPALPRLRLSSLDCIETDRALLACLADEPRFMPHLHLSVQAGADLILKRMARRHSRADVLHFCRTARRLRPDVVFGVDLIAGFPTETDDHFAATLDLIQACDLTYVHAFPYSARPGTPAARMPAVPAPIVKARADRIRAAGAAQLVRHLDRQIGRTLAVLAERGGAGHAEDFTRVTMPAGLEPGSIHHLVAVGHDGRSVHAAHASQSFGNHSDQ